jgi:hypothetical protein
MGLLDAVFKVVYKADTRELTQGLKGLQGEEKKLQEQRILAANEYNKAVDSQLERLKSYKEIIVGVGHGVKVALDLIEFAGKRADLSAAAAGVSIDGLRKATLGLRSDTELLGTAAKLNHSVFTVSQKDMETAARAMTALGERGGDAQAAIDAVTDALVTGKTKGLKAYGIEIDETKDKATKYAEIMKALTTVSGEVSEATLDQSDKVSQLKVNFANSVDKMKESIGGLAMSLEPLLAALAKAVGLIADIVAGAKITDDVEDLIRNRNVTSGGMVMGTLAIDQDRRLREKIQGISGLSGLGRGGGAAGGAYQSALLKQASGGGGFNAEATDIGSQIMSGVSGAGIDVALDRIQEALIAKATAETAAMIRQSGSATAGSYDLNALQGQLDQFQGGEFGKRNAAAYGAYNARKQQSFLSSTFGEIDEFNLYATAFTTLSGAVGASLTAWIDGSMSAGQAFKKFIGEALKGVAVQMAMEALKHGAYALGSLAFGDFAGAATHGKAALAFAAGAAITASAAKEFGGNAPSVGGGARVGAPNVGGGSGQQGPTITTIVYSDSFAEDSARGKQLQAKRMVERAIGSEAVSRS